MKKQKLAVILFFAALFLIGALVTGDYGMPYDEKQEQSILNSNIREYMIRFGLERFIPEDPEADGTDYRISTSVERDHGIACYYPIGWYILNRDSRTTREVNFVWQAYTYCLNFIGVLACYGLVKRLTGRRLGGCAAALTLFLCPRMFAEMHYNNKDMVSLTLCLVTLYFGVRWILEEKRRFAVAFGIASAFAVNARLINVFMFGLVGLNVLIPLLKKRSSAVSEEEKRVLGRSFADGFIAIGVCALTYVLITPALWAGPLRFARYLIRYSFSFTRWDDFILFGGEIYKRSVIKLPRVYLPVYILLTTPVWASVCILSGTVLVWFRGIRSRFTETRLRLACMVSLAGLFPILLAVVLQTHIYNGWRQFYFVFGPMAVTAGILADAIFEKLRQRKLLYAAPAAALAGCMAWTGVGLVSNHPYQFAYINALAGENPSERYELDYWHVSAGPLIRSLMESIGTERHITLSALVVQDSHAVYYARRQLTEAQKQQVEITSEDLTADYILVNLSYSYRIPEESRRILEENYRVVATAEAYGNPLIQLYERIG